MIQNVIIEVKNPQNPDFWPKAEITAKSTKVIFIAKRNCLHASSKGRPEYEYISCTCICIK
jgi:hypothetical protein